MKTREQYHKFIEALEANGDCFFTLGSVKQDIEYINGLINIQGYYAGIADRYYFDKEFNLIRTESRF